MSTLSDALKEQVTIRSRKDKNTGHTITRAELCLFTEYRTMWPVPESAQQHIHSHLRKSLVHYLEDEAYDGLHKKIYDLERCIRDRNAYDSVTADIISDILTIISS